MSKRFEDLPGYHGDTDAKVDLHHSEPTYWTKKMTIKSAVLILLVILVSIFAYKTLLYML